ncbi:DNA ligase [Vibrio japonicus]|uniref:DNA ligase n=1 Tax=Vibrio japonicus TaxID=1824638 RepID=A0ABY5LPR8_9VIBR|nr:DNA ligase [Vibrio japonicus]UUM31730.1 DNA ligase [Vibrio japonicus]
MQFHLSKLSIFIVSVLFPVTDLAYADTHSMPVTLAKNYSNDVDVKDYWVSEKLDGIRAIWNGKKLLTRNGVEIKAPSWFTQPLPDYPLEGELWAGRGKFHLVQQTVLDQTPIDKAWKQIDFMLFDMPQAAGDYTKRYYNIVYFTRVAKSDHIKYIEHLPVETEQSLYDYLDQVDDKKGEGLMLRKITSRYQAGRSNDLVKLKKFQDAEALVIGYKGGKGKYRGQMGALLVQLESGQQFYLGSGFNDLQRQDPPKIGTTITFRYNGYTQNGVPKFARFIRERVN